MILLSCSRLARGFDQGPLFEDIGFELYSGERVGLVGPNGAGKTSLFKLILGQLTPDAGSVSIQKSLKVGVLEQDPKFDPAALSRND